MKWQQLGVFFLSPYPSSGKKSEKTKLGRKLKFEPSLGIV